jgi:hypothetical protein
LRDENIIFLFSARIFGKGRSGVSEAVAAHAFGVESLRDGKPIGNIWMIAVEGGIEAGNLQNVRLPL